MGCQFNKTSTSTGCQSDCPTTDGCIPGVCPEFVIKRHDTKPAFKVSVEDCDGPIDLTDLVAEASMWATAKLKTAITETDDTIYFADRIGFEQVMVGDVIVMDRARTPEHMLVVAFDEDNYGIQVTRGYHGTTASIWKKGAALKIIKFLGVTATTEMLYEDITQIDGTTLEDQLTESFLIYEWGENDTCLPGCYYFEFKLLKMLETSDIVEESDTPSSVTLTPSDFNCGLGLGVEWVRRFPQNDYAFYLQILDSPTAEL